MPKTHRVTLEYVLLEGVNDAPEDARRLAKLAQGLRGKINLIPLNPDPELPYKRPTREAVEAFQQILCDEKLTANVRWSKGLDVDAACGQLAGRWRPKDE
jgi:23S rRNA (adenine2503-C2)-methyltransferase